MAELKKQYQHPEHPRLYIQHRGNSKFLQAVTFFNGGYRQKSLGIPADFNNKGQFNTALKLAETWFLSLHEAQSGAKDRKKRDPLDAPLMEHVFTDWCHELTEKKLKQAKMKWGPIAEFWHNKRVTDVDTSMFKDFYRWRRGQKTRKGTKISNHTMHKDVVYLRQLLKYAREEGHIDALPAIPKVGTIEPNPRPWLTEQEYQRLLKVSGERIQKAVGNPKLHQQRFELDQQIRFLVETMMRIGEAFPCDDEARPIRFNHCRIQKNKKNEWVLISEVHGKRGGHRTNIGRHEAAKIFDSRKAAAKSDNDLVFPVHHRDALTELLIAANLHKDAFGMERNFKSLRATSISRAILRAAEKGEAPNLFMIARNAGTSVQVIDQFYAKRLTAEMGLDVLTA